MADNTSTCPGCGTKFSTFKWKHQCHRCNAVRCHDCSSHKMPIPKLGITKPERVCDLCFIALNLAQKNTSELEQFPVKLLKQFALDYNIPAALTNALEKSDIISGLLKYYDPNQDRTHERTSKDREKKQKKKQQQKHSTAEYPGNVNTNQQQYAHSNNNANNVPKPEPYRTYSDNFFDNFAGLFNGGSAQVTNNQQQAQNRPNNSNNNQNSNSGVFDGFFEGFDNFFNFNNGAHPFNPPQQYQSANGNTNNVYNNNGAYNNNGGSSSQYSNPQQQNSSYGQSHVNNSSNANYSNSNNSNNRSNGHPQQQQQAPPRVDPQPQAPVGEAVIPENFDLNEMSVSQLKEILKRHRIDFKDCFEKSDLIQKIRDKIMNKTSDADKKPPSSSANNTNSNDNNVAYNEKVGSEEKDVCVICQDRHIKCVFLECGHLACCMECSVKVQHCPLCRKYISRVVEIYHAYK